MTSASNSDRPTETHVSQPEPAATTATTLAQTMTTIKREETTATTTAAVTNTTSGEPPTGFRPIGAVHRDRGLPVSVAGREPWLRGGWVSF